MTDSIEHFLKAYRIKKFMRGELILTEDEKPQSAYFIKSGIVKTYNLTAKGQEKPISFDVAGEILPLGWVFGKLSHTQYFYEAYLDCELYCVPRDDFIAYLRKNHNYHYEYTYYLVKRYLQFQMRINALEQSKASDKVIHTLYYFCMRFGHDLKPDVVSISLPLTQQDMANFMGLTRETTGIELKS